MRGQLGGVEARWGSSEMVGQRAWWDGSLYGGMAACMVGRQRAWWDGSVHGGMAACMVGWQRAW